MPLFQHRHLCALAKALEEVSDIAETAPVINALICALQRDNPRFDAARFRAACAGQPTPKDRRTTDLLPTGPWVSTPSPRRLWWVATYGEDGINVTFQRTRAEWDARENEVTEAVLEYTSWTAGWEDIS